MQKIEYLLYLTSDETDRLRVTAMKDAGEIREFVVQYEARLMNSWHPVVRYDTAHGFAHKDILSPKGAAIKQPLHFETFNLAFTFASLDLKANWRTYRDRYEQEMEDDKR